MNKVLDLSHWNDVDFVKLKRHNPDITGVILKAGQYSQDKRRWYQDSKFDKFYKEAVAAGFDVGAYYYSTAHTDQQAMTEVAAFANYIRDYHLTLPVVADFEDHDYSAEQLNIFILLTGDYLESLGYYYMVYLNSYLYTLMSDDNKEMFAVWIAAWSKDMGYYKGVEGIVAHQYTSTGRPIGANTDVDISLLHKNLASIIEREGLNERYEDEDVGCSCGCCYTEFKEVE